MARPLSLPVWRHRFSATCQQDRTPPAAPGGASPAWPPSRTSAPGCAETDGPIVPGARGGDTGAARADGDRGPGAQWPKRCCEGHAGRTLGTSCCRGARVPPGDRPGRREEQRGQERPERSVSLHGRGRTAWWRRAAFPRGVWGQSTDREEHRPGRSGLSEGNTRVLTPNRGKSRWGLTRIVFTKRNTSQQNKTLCPRLMLKAPGRLGG